MKKILSLLAALLCIGLVLAGCKNNSDSSDENNAVGNSGGSGNETSEQSVAAGWYSYTTSGGGYYQTTYFYFNAGGVLERAGSDKYEYSGTELSTLQSTMTYSLCLKNAASSDMVAFSKCDAPSWSGDSGNEGDSGGSTSGGQQQPPTIKTETLDLVFYDIDIVGEVPSSRVECDTNTEVVVRCAAQNIALYTFCIFSDPDGTLGYFTIKDNKVKANLDKWPVNLMYTSISVFGWTNAEHFDPDNPNRLGYSAWVESIGFKRPETN